MSLRAEGVADETRRDVDDADHPVVGHPRRPDDAERADDAAFYLEWRRHHRELLVGNDEALAADEDAHALGAPGDLEQPHKERLLLEQVEKLAQAAEVAREVLDREEVPLA